MNQKNPRTIVQQSFPKIKNDANSILKEHSLYLRTLTQNDQNQDIV